MRMKSNILLTSAIMMCSVGQVMADSYTNNQEYGSSCNVNVLGVSSGSKGATANFEIDSFTCAPGTYLPADGLSCVQCSAGNFCGGDTYNYDASTAQGLSACPSGYTSSLSGASSNTECYTACVASDVAHAATVTGNNYYGDGVDTCAPVTCVTGYTKQTVKPTLPDINADSNGINAANWTTTWTSGDVQGTATGIWSCNTTSGTQDTADANLNVTGGEQTGENCWCKMTNWTPSGESVQDAASLWVFSFTNSSASDCAYRCAYDCGFRVRNNSVLRSGLFGSVTGKDVCVANTITINWGDGAGGTHESNTCTYDGALTTPESAPTKRGYHFTGWTFE